MPTPLDRLSTLDSDLRIAVLGIGSIGRCLVHQAQITPRMRPVAIADVRRERAVECATMLGLPFALVDDARELTEALDRGVVAIAASADLLTHCERIDVCFEATNATLCGYVHARDALRHGQHVIMMNFEADLMFGLLLVQEARRQARVYTTSDGDQPTAIKRVVDDILLWGFELCVAGNIKGYHDLYVNPTTIAPEADKRGLDHKMCSSYTDGTKLCVEMAVVANALDMVAARPGMHGPRIRHVLDVFEHIDIERLWREHGAFVDYVVGAEPRGGVFAIGYTESALQRHTLGWYPPRMGPGPFYLFYRPYHLGAIEAMNCVVEAVLDGTARLQPRGMNTNVFAHAKKDLRAGDRVDGMGGYAAYGLIDNLDVRGSHPGLPILLADDLVLRRDVAKDRPILLDDVDCTRSSAGLALYREAIGVGAGR
ncbi:MAG: homoserine dehydrogenase [Planctomycetota bacterium]